MRKQSEGMGDLFEFCFNRKWRRHVMSRESMALEERLGS